MENSKSNLWRTLTVLFFSFLFWGGSLSAYAAKMAWVECNRTIGTLTFKYGEKTTLSTGYISEYRLNGVSTNPEWASLNSNVTKVVFDPSFASALPTSCFAWFKGCQRLTTIIGIEYLNTSNVKNMANMFYGCSGLTSLDVSNFNTSNVTNMTNMFYNCSGLTSLDVSNFNTSEVTIMGGMFAACSGLTTLDVSSFNTSKVTIMQGMFLGCQKMETIFASDKFDVSNVTSSNNMFTYCTSLMGYDENKTDKTYATVDGGYFTNPYRPWVKYADGTLTFQYGFKTTLGTDEYLLNEGSSVPEWLNKSSSIKTVVFDKSFAQARPTSCCHWFYGCNILSTIEGIENFNTSNVTSMSNMFNGCSGLTSLDLSNFDTSNVTDMNYMFNECYGLEKIFASDKFVTTSVTYDKDLFTNCTKLVGDIAYDESKTDKTYAKFDGGYFRDKNLADCPWVKYADGTLTFQYGYKKTLGTDEYWLNEGNSVPGWLDKSSSIKTVVFGKTFAQARPTSCYFWFCNCSELSAIKGIENLNTSNVTTMQYMFYRCESLTSLDLSNFDTSNVTNMQYMFYYCESLTSLDLSHFDTSNVTSMKDMFYYCPSLTSLDLSHFDTSNLESMSRMFFRCSSLTSLDLSHFDTSNVTSMSSMFYFCSSLTSLDLSNFDTSNVTSMSSMFYRCESLTSLDLSNFDTSNVTSMSRMFYYCSSLTSLDLSNFDTSKVTNMTEMFYESPNLKTVYFGDGFNVNKLESITYDNIFSGCSATLYCSPKQFDSFKNNSVIASFGNAVKPYVSINKKSEYGTLCVPVGSSLAEDSFTGFDKLYQVTNADKDKGTITLAEAKSIEPGVPYVYHRYLEGVDFESKNDMSVITFDVDENASAAVTAPKNEGSLLKGTFESMLAKGGSYILQSDGNFHPVAADNKTLKVGAYRAYLDLSSKEIGGGDEGVGAAKGYRMVFEDGEATGIDRINGEGTDGTDKGIYDQADQQPKVYFDLMGRKVNAPQKGEIYIVNGKKVVYNK